MLNKDGRTRTLGLPGVASGAGGKGGGNISVDRSHLSCVVYLDQINQALRRENNRDIVQKEYLSIIVQRNSMEI